MNLVPIGKVSEIKSGFAFKSDDYLSQGIKLIRIGNLDGVKLIYNDNTVCISDEVAKRASDFFLKENDVLIAMSGATTGKVALVRNVDLPCLLNQRVGRFTVVENKLNPKYLFYYLADEKIKERILKVSGGSAQPNISPDQLKNFEIPLPDLKTQQQIAEVLEEADKARQQRKAASALTDEFLQSSFLSLFGDPVKNEKGWERGKIRDVVSEVKYGTSKPAEENGAYPYLRMNNITYEGNWDFSSMKYINLTNDEREKYLLRRGDLVFNRTNSKELVGKTAVYNLDDEMAIAGYLIRVRANEKADPYYLSGYLNSEHGKSKLFAMCKNIVGMANINAQELQDIEILIPPISLQQQFAAIVAQAEQLRQKQKESEQELESLFHSLLQKYFG